MGDEGEDAPTGIAPTELGAAAVEGTEAHTAWSLDEGEDWPPRGLTPGRITALAIAGALVLIGGAAAVAFVYLRDRDESTPTEAAPTSSAIATTSPPAPTATQAAPPPPPAPVSIPMDHYGQVHVRTVSGRTVCAMTAGDVQCNVRFTTPLGPDNNGLPVSGVGVTSRGAWQWLYGDPGNPDYVTMNYGTIYQALGWTITPTSDGTTFIYDATGHGMTISVDGFSPF